MSASIDELRGRHATLVDRARRMEEIGRSDIADEIRRMAEQVFEEETRRFSRSFCGLEDPGDRS